MKYLIVDLESAFWGPAMGGMPAHEVPGAVMRSVRSIAKDYDRVVCVAGGHEDGKMPCTGTSFRAHYWPEYKADRKERSEDKWQALSALIADCRAEGWPVIEAPEWASPDADNEARALFYEGDDVAATCAARLTERGHLVTIYSSDSDLTQCINADVKLLRRTKTGELALLDWDAVTAWLGVPPDRVAEMKALAGDGDGYKPFPGIAEGNARKMLSAVAEPTARAVVAYVEAMAEEKRNAYHRAIAAGAANLERAYIAARVVKDVPLDLSILEAEPVRQAPRDAAAGMLPEGDFESGPERSSPLQPNAIVLSDVSARMIAPAEEAFYRMTEFKAFVSRCMVKDVDYGTIPGTPKPTLYKPGAEKLCEIYGYAPRFKEERRIERWDGPNPLFFYVIRCSLHRKADGMLVAECLGSCNTWESKYRDRWVYPSDLPSDIDLSTLEYKEYQKKGGGTYRKYKVANPAPFDLVNTVLKMAEKRAHVGATILATRSGGVFAQDLDSIPREAFGESYGQKQWEQ